MKQTFVATLLLSVTAAGAALAAPEFSADAVEAMPGHEMRYGRLFVSDKGSRFEFQVSGWPVIEIRTGDGRLLTLFPLSRTYVESKPMPGLVSILRPETPCSGVQDAECKKEAADLPQGTKLELYKITAKGAPGDDRVWWDPQRRMEVRHEYADGRVMQATMRMQMPAAGRTVESWEHLFMSPGGQFRRQITVFAPDLNVAIFDQEPGGAMRELRNIEVKALDPALFTLPAGYSKSEPPPAAGEGKSAGQPGGAMTGNVPPAAHQAAPAAAAAPASSAAHAAAAAPAAVPTAAPPTTGLGAAMPSGPAPGQMPPPAAGFGAGPAGPQGGMAPPPMMMYPPMFAPPPGPMGGPMAGMPPMPPSAGPMQAPAASAPTASSPAPTPAPAAPAGSPPSAPAAALPGSAGLSAPVQAPMPPPPPYPGYALPPGMPMQPPAPMAAPQPPSPQADHTAGAPVAPAGGAGPYTFRPFGNVGAAAGPAGGGTFTAGGGYGQYAGPGGYGQYAGPGGYAPYGGPPPYGSYGWQGPGAIAPPEPADQKAQAPASPGRQP